MGFMGLRVGSHPHEHFVTETFSQALRRHWVRPPFSNNWIISIVWLYIALNRTRIWTVTGGGGAVPNVDMLS